MADVYFACTDGGSYSCISLDYSDSVTGDFGVLYLLTHFYEHTLSFPTYNLIKESDKSRKIMPEYVVGDNYLSICGVKAFSTSSEITAITCSCMIPKDGYRLYEFMVVLKDAGSCIVWVLLGYPVFCFCGSCSNNIMLIQEEPRPEFARLLLSGELSKIVCKKL